MLVGQLYIFGDTVWYIAGSACRKFYRVLYSFILFFRTYVRSIVLLFIHSFIRLFLYFFFFTKLLLLSLLLSLVLRLYGAHIFTDFVQVFVHLFPVFSPSNASLPSVVFKIVFIYRGAEKHPVCFECFFICRCRRRRRNSTQLFPLHFHPSLIFKLLLSFNARRYINSHCTDGYMMIFRNSFLIQFSVLNCFRCAEHWKRFLIVCFFVLTLKKRVRLHKHKHKHNRIHRFPRTLLGAVVYSN